MRKFLSFLALLVVGFALPQWASADTLYLYKSNGNTPGQLASASSETGVYVFNVGNITSGTYVGFATAAGQTDWNNLGTRYGTPNQDTGIPGKDLSVENGNNMWRVTREGAYTLTLDLNNKKLTAKCTPNNLYLYSSNSDWKTLLGSQTLTDGVYTYNNVTLAADECFVLSTVSSTDGWATISSGLYSPGSDTSVTSGTAYSFDIASSGAWKCATAGTYDIVVNWNDMTLTATRQDPAPSTLYLYNTSGPTQLSSAKPDADGNYTFVVTLTNGTGLVFSTNGGATTWDALQANSGRYNPNNTDVNIPASSISIVQTNTGALIANGDGKYTITVNWETKSVTATAVTTTTPVVVSMPLTSADFANGKKHYFLVGDRCGEWRLLPEWELKVDGNTATLNNRFMYDGYIGVAVVDNYNDYTAHKYTLYKGTYWFQAGADGSADLTLAGSMAIGKGTTCGNPYSNGMRINYNGSAQSDGYFGQQYWDGYGQFVSTITVTLSDAGQPSLLAMTPDSDSAAENRVFTLCGSNIYNRSFSIANGGATYRSNLAGSGDGWQEGWIQYNPATGRPYVDANGEYLYLTSFTPDYMQSHPVYFNMAITNGDFLFTSGEIQFVESSKLSNYDNDPYKAFYSAFSNTESITDSGDEKAGDGYNFKVGTKNGGVVSPSSAWHCYVIRDVWMAGEYKFWSGWGGNVQNTNGTGGTGATWHGLNGGPDITKGDNQQALGFDIATGQTVLLYKNVQNRDDTNYMTGTADTDKTPKYYNRVVLWYNEAGGVSQSFLQLIQESAGPAIFAKVVANDNDADLKNYIDYNWYLNKAINETDGDNLVYGYRIERYRMVDGAAEFIGYPEGESVQLDTPVTISSLYEGTEAKFTSYHDTGVVPGDGFSPGVYQYKVYVYFDEAMTIDKEATSNKVVIYADSYAEPDAVPLQIIELRDAYTDNYGTEHASGVKFFDTANTTNTKRYLTYRENASSTFYLFDIETVTGDDGEEVEVPANAEIVEDSSVALDLIENHPDMYYWTSDYYVRCLDYDAYESSMQRAIDAELISGDAVPEPKLTVREKITANGEVETKDCAVGRLFEIGDKRYYSAIVRRGGNLADGVFSVELSYTFNDYDGNVQSHNVSKSAAFDPVTPLPYSPLYRYVYTEPVRSTSAAIGGKSYGKILAPHENWNDYTNTTAAIKADAMKDTYVNMSDGNFATRTLTLQVDFSRPNVKEDIYKYYDIQYSVEMNNNEGGDADVPMSMEAVLHDTAVKANDNRYRMEFKGMHPRDEVYPTVKFVKTEYVPNQSADASTDETFKSQVGKFGKQLTIEAKHSLYRNASTGFTNVRLGKIKRANGTWDWMYKGHDEFVDNAAKVAPTDNPYEDTAFYTAKNEDGTLKNPQYVEPLYYLIELKNDDGDQQTYEYLVPHKTGHRAEDATVDTKTGLVLNDDDPLIGTYIATGFGSDANPTFHATAIYLFERSVYGQSENVMNFNKLAVKSIKFTNTGGGEQTIPAAGTTEAATKAAVAPGDLTGEVLGKLETEGLGNMPNVGTASALDENSVYDMSAANAVTGYNSYIAVKGPHYAYTLTNATVTGVEDVLAGYEDGEAVYYNLQGVRIAEPTAAGVYLKVQGKNVSKIVVK